MQKENDPCVQRLHQKPAPSLLNPDFARTPCHPCNYKTSPKPSRNDNSKEAGGGKVPLLIVQFQQLLRTSSGYVITDRASRNRGPPHLSSPSRHSETRGRRLFFAPDSLLARFARQSSASRTYIHTEAFLPSEREIPPGCRNTRRL